MLHVTAAYFSSQCEITICNLRGGSVCARAPLVLYSVFKHYQQRETQQERHQVRPSSSQEGTLEKDLRTARDLFSFIVFLIQCSKGYILLLIRRLNSTALIIGLCRHSYGQRTNHYLLSMSENL